MFPACSLPFHCCFGFVLRYPTSNCGFLRISSRKSYRLTELLGNYLRASSGRSERREKTKSETLRNILGLLLGMNSPLRHWSQELSTNSNEIAFFCCRSDGEIIMNCDIFIGSVSDRTACKNSCSDWWLWGWYEIMGLSWCLLIFYQVPSSDKIFESKYFLQINGDPKSGPITTPDDAKFVPEIRLSYRGEGNR